MEGYGRRAHFLTAFFDNEEEKKRLPRQFLAGKKKKKRFTHGFEEQDRTPAGQKTVFVSSSFPNMSDQITFLRETKQDQISASIRFRASFTGRKSNVDDSSTGGNSLFVHLTSLITQTTCHAIQILLRRHC
jgi:hypothetical protein